MITNIDILKSIFILEHSDQVEKALANKAKATGISKSVLKDVYEKGLAAWKTGHRPGVGQHQWAMARVNSFVTGGRTTEVGDKKLYQQAKANRKKKK